MKKWLIIQTAFIGDVVLATPIIEKIRQHYPEATIDFLLRKGNESLLAHHPHLNRVLIWYKKGSKYQSLWQILKQIRQERYDVVVNCQRFGASGLLTALSGAKHTVGFDKNPFSRFFSKRVPHVVGQTHEVERNLSLIHHLTDSQFVRPALYPTPADYTKAKSVSQGRAYVCMAPTSVWFTKQWPAHKWVELIQALPAETTVFLLGGPPDRAACDRIAQQAGGAQVFNLAGQLSFLESAALMQGATMNYVNDSAPIHIASAINAPVTAIFCSTVPAFGFTPLSDRRQVIETTSPLPCRPCGLHGHAACPKGHFQCAEDISISAVLEG